MFAAISARAAILFVIPLRISIQSCSCGTWGPPGALPRKTLNTCHFSSRGELPKADPMKGVVVISKIIKTLEEKYIHMAMS